MTDVMLRESRLEDKDRISVWRNSAEVARSVFKQGRRRLASIVTAMPAIGDRLAVESVSKVEEFRGGSTRAEVDEVFVGRFAGVSIDHSTTSHEGETIEDSDSCVTVASWPLMGDGPRPVPAPLRGTGRIVPRPPLHSETHICGARMGETPQRGEDWLWGRMIHQQHMSTDWCGLRGDGGP